MNKKICSIVVASLTLFTSCEQGMKQDTATKNISNKKNEAAPIIKHSDPLLHSHSTATTKKLSCCIGPPSRVKAKPGKN